MTCQEQSKEAWVFLKMMLAWNLSLTTNREDLWVGEISGSISVSKDLFENPLDISENIPKQILFIIIVGSDAYFRLFETKFPTT